MGMVLNMMNLDVRFDLADGLKETFKTLFQYEKTLAQPTKLQFRGRKIHYLKLELMCKSGNSVCDLAFSKNLNAQTYVMT
mmetsp:Transcript_33054/g.43513  ORF Transcript_33054/g.43513 Transcript_33054/m.43513 type:complete len:80 (+) Transcript_33054:1443-1682(+)